MKSIRQSKKLYMEQVRFSSLVAIESILFLDWEVNTPFKNYKREEIGKIIEKKNKNWLSKLQKNPEQLKVVEWMILSLKSLPITPNTISNVDDDDFCWVLFFYDSNNHK